ncbi:hypothetical protein AAFF_G00166410 [Aldrovandia affinis]|uniref:Uncharacterized protein n=1 Tax=Aldrovandia affinis TaxID=143900 RepID=A0AAD7W791_9TELE|nr:hypothetical protein AAFF_G00166410 [Aldrovandia affinis]
MGSSSDIISEVHPQPSGLNLHQSTSPIGSAGNPGAFDPGSQAEAREATGSEAPDTESNGNGQKLLLGRAPEGLAGTDHLADGTVHIDSAGLVDHSIIDPHIDLTDHTGTITQIASTNLGSDPGLSSSSGSHPDAPALSPGYMSGMQTDSAGGSDTGAFGDHSHAPGETGAGNHDVPISFISDTTDIALLSDMMSHSDHSHIDYPEGAVDASSTGSADTNGNGRQGLVAEMHQTGSQLVTDTHNDVTGSSDQQVITTEALPQVVTGGVETHTIIPQTDAIDTGVEPATSSHIPADATGKNSGLADVTMFQRT